jgi:hypothetical protein
MSIAVMSRQLDILAIEPFHGGARRAMLETVARFSRHRWKILKLPPRKMERRLLVSATWFAEHLSRNGVGKVDLLFTSEALNLAEFLRLRPDLAKKPSVVYFHDNQLPEAGGDLPEKPTDLVNLNSAMAANEIWFNSLYHLRTFLGRASGMVARHEELQMRNPMARLAAKAHLVPPPIDLAEMQDAESIALAKGRDPRSVLLDARGARHVTILHVLRILQNEAGPVKLSLIGRVKGLPASLRAIELDERNQIGHINALRTSGVLLSARPDAPSDDLVVRALASGCLPIAPSAGVYPELLPEPMHERCLHDGTPESMAEKLLEAWYAPPLRGMEFLIDEIISPFDCVAACRVIDERVEQLVGVARLPEASHPKFKAMAAVAPR